MMEISTHLMLLILTIFGSTFNRIFCAGTSLPCVVLEECDVVRTLIENQNSSIAQNVLQTIGSQLVCGRNNDGSILVRCPNTYSDDNTNYAVIDTNGNTSTRRCTGHVTFYYNAVQRSSQAGEVSQLRGMRIRGRRPRLAFLGTNNQMFGLTINGQCCWKLHSNPQHRGQSQTLAGGYSGMPNFQPKSIKKTRC